MRFTDARLRARHCKEVSEFMHRDIEQILFTEEEIKARVHEMGKFVSEHFADAADEGIILVTTLRGAAIFSSDLARCIDVPLEMDYMALSSYGNETTSSGRVRIEKDLSSSIEGRHVVIAEDVIDSGQTLAYVIPLLWKRKPASIDVVALLHKSIEGQVPVDCLCTGFECPTAFVVGYGLDYAQKYRNLPYIGVLKPEVYQK